MRDGLATSRKIAATVALILWGAYWHLVFFRAMSSVGFGDFGRFYYAARLWRDGASLYGPSLATWLQVQSGAGMHLWNLNPPHVSLIFLPLSFLRVEHAYTIWALLTVCCLVLSARMILHTLGTRPAGATLALLTAFVFASTPTLGYGGTGNVTGPLALLLTWTWTQWRTGRSRRAGVGIGIAWSVKLFFLPLVLYLFTRREWRAGLLALATGAALFALGMSVFGWSEHLAWFRAVDGIQWPWLAQNSSIVGPFARAAYVANGEAIAAPQIAAFARLGVECAAVLAVLGVLTASRDASRDRGFLTMLLTCLLTFPLGWLYYWWVFAGPLAASLRWRAVRRGFWLSLPGWLVPMAFVWPYGSVLFAATLGSLYSWSLLALWSGAVASAWTDPNDPPVN